MDGYLTLGIICAIALGVVCWMDGRNRPEAGHTRLWCSERDSGHIEPPQHCDAPWDPWRDDRGPTGRRDVTPGGRQEKAAIQEHVG